VENFLKPIKDGELSYLLRLPFIDKEFYDNVEYNKFYSIIDSFFKIKENEDKIGLTTQVQQCFYNTIDIPTQWHPYIFKESSNIINFPKVPIVLNLNIDNNYLLISDYQNLDNLLFNIKLKLIEFLSLKEGFQIEFFESGFNPLKSGH